MIYFISGHRDLSYEDFNKYMIKIIHVANPKNDKKCKFLVGDCNGLDKMAMDFIYNMLIDPLIYEKGISKAELVIYHMHDSPRNTPLDFPIEELKKVGVKFLGGFKSDEERDSAMTRDSDFDIAFIKDDRWDSGTAQNIKRRNNI